MTMQKKMLKTAAAACAAALAAVLLAGCGDEASKKTYSPVPFTKHDRCHLCGMVLAHYEGPKAQIIIKGAEDTPLMFCSGRDAFTYALQPENQRRQDLLGDARRRRARARGFRHVRLRPRPRGRDG